MIAGLLEVKYWNRQNTVPPVVRRVTHQNSVMKKFTGPYLKTQWDYSTLAFPSSCIGLPVGTCTHGCRHKSEHAHEDAHTLQAHSHSFLFCIVVAIGTHVHASTRKDKSSAHTNTNNWCVLVCLYYCVRLRVSVCGSAV